MAKHTLPEETTPAAGEAPAVATVNAPVNPPADANPSADKLTPLEWAERNGMLGKADPRFPQIAPSVSAAYAAADALHGWAHDAHNYQAPGQQLKLTEADFNAALEAGLAYPAKPAHGPACGRGFEGRAKPVTDSHTNAVLSGATETAKGTKRA